MFDASSLAALLSGVQSQQPAPAPVPQPTTPLATNLGGILSGDPNFGGMIRQIGGGLANMSNAGGDPYLAFAQGFGGAQQYATTQQKEAAERAAALQKQQMDANLALQRLTQDQSQFDASLANNQSQFSTRSQQDQAQFDQRMELERAADKRADQIAADNRRKTDAEILRLAKREGLTPDQMLRINDAAQKATEDIIDPAERRSAYNAEVERLTQATKSGRLSDGPGISEADTMPAAVPTATGPNGEKLTLSPDGTQWVPVAQ